jgi:hypothetical protein
LLLAAGFIAALLYAPVWVVAAIVTIILGLAAVEFYDKVAEKGYRPAAVTGHRGAAWRPRSPRTGSVTARCH